MKKLLALLSALALLLCSLSPALAKTPAATAAITFDEFRAAFDALSAQMTGHSVSWEESGTDSGVFFGSIGLNPMLILSGEQVSMATVLFSFGEEESFELYADLFILLSTMVAAVPAVRDGMSVTEAMDAVYPELQELMSGIGSGETNLTGGLGGTNATFRFSTDANGGVILSLLLTYHLSE